MGLSIDYSDKELLGCIDESAILEAAKDLAELRIYFPDDNDIRLIVDELLIRAEEVRMGGDLARGNDLDRIIKGLS
jgi:hypothetical protein